MTIRTLRILLGSALALVLFAVGLAVILPRDHTFANSSVARPRKNLRVTQLDPPPVQVKVTRIAEPSHVSYLYNVVNGSAFPITGLSIGNDDYAQETELAVAPLGWHGDSIPSTPESSVKSPSNWSFEFISTEGGEPGTADWRAKTPSEAIAGGTSRSGFAVLTSQQAAAYEQGHWTVYLRSSEEISYTGLLQPSGITSVPTSSVFAQSDLRIKPSPSAGPFGIQFIVPASGSTTVDVFDAQGRLVRRILSKSMPVGDATVNWDAKDSSGKEVAAGQYFVRVKTPSTTRFSRVTVLR